MKKILNFPLLLFFLLWVNVSYSQVFTTADYKKAEWMTARFYGAQRASLKTGEPTNWLLLNHGKGIDFNNDNDGGYDLTGGWFDCGDHPMFGQTQFYSAYVLLKGYDVWPSGYGDYYSQNYAGYNKAQNFNWEGVGHDPDGIPDILNEVKYATDFFIKAARDTATFYSQKGQGNYDHKHWITSVKMATLGTTEGGQDRRTYKNVVDPKTKLTDASMASFCGASLALMSRIYRKYNSAYADTCLKHALYAYSYAKANPGTSGSPEDAFYGANQRWQDDYASMCTELYYATKDEKYKTEALSYDGYLENHNFCFGYNNNDDIAAYNLATLGSERAAVLLNTFATTYASAVNAGGIYTGGDIKWGTLRYNANAAFVIALNSVLKKQSGVNPFIYKQIDFILGNNGLGENGKSLSFVVGFGNNSVKYPHHRNVYLTDVEVPSTTILSIPARNAQFGYLVGGIRSGVYNDYRDNYETAEGGIDYSAGLVGALAYILSETASLVPDSMFISSKPFAASYLKTSTISVNFKPAKSYSDVTWIIRDTAIAQVQFNGSVSGKKLGTTTIIAKTKDGKFIDSTTCEVKVLPVSGVTVYPLNILAGKTAKSVFVVTPNNATNPTVTWKMADTTIATVSSLGIIAALSVGTTTITATTVDGSFTSSNTINVVDNPSLSKVYFAKTAPTIDGNLDESLWVLDKTISKPVIGVINNSTSFGIMWDSNYVYVGIKVKDAVITTKNPNVYDNDAIELYFDMNHNGGAYDAADRSWIKVVNSSSIWEKVGTRDGAVTSKSSVISATKIIDGGYAMEFAIPWSTLGVKPNTTTLYGFDLALDDADGGLRINQDTWVGTLDDWQDLTNVGTIQLSTKLAVSTIDDEEPTKIIVSPNPAKNTFRVKCATQSVVSSTVLDIFGRELTQKSGVGDMEFDCNSYQSGIYFIRIIMDNKVITRSLIIEKQ